MPFEQHQEKNYAKDAQSIYQAALKATENHSGPGSGRTHRTLVRSAYEWEGGMVVVDEFPLDAVERKLMFGARKGVTQTVVTWFIAHLENNLGLPLRSNRIFVWAIQTD
jgi:hypothetical protein